MLAPIEVRCEFRLSPQCVDSSILVLVMFSIRFRRSMGAKAIHHLY